MLYIIIITVLTVIDQFTKSEMLAVAEGKIGYSIPVIQGFFHFTYVENHGGIFGLFQGKIGVFTIVSLILLGYVVFTEYKNFKNYCLVCRRRLHNFHAICMFFSPSLTFFIRYARGLRSWYAH